MASHLDLSPLTGYAQAWSEVQMGEDGAASAAVALFPSTQTPLARWSVIHERVPCVLQITK